MSVQNNGISCALCHAYLFEEDDVVYCPECGAPHHRECYNSIGKCALAELHGTENQYDKVKRVMEEQQQEERESEETQNAAEFETPFGPYSPIDFLGGIKPEQPIDEGVTAKEAAKFVLSNTMRYIPKFAKLGSKNKISWNFMAFLFPCGWFLSRKMYRNGIIAGVLEVVATLLTVPFQKVLYSFGISGMVYSAQVIEKISQNIDKIPPNIFLAAVIGSLLSIAVSVISALFGDWIYKKHAVSRIKEIKASSEDKEYDYRKKGGVNLFMFIIGIFALQYIPAIIVTLI